MRRRIPWTRIHAPQPLQPCQKFGEVSQRQPQSTDKKVAPVMVVTVLAIITYKRKRGLKVEHRAKANDKRGIRTPADFSRRILTVYDS